MAFGSISVDRIVDSEGSVFSPSSVSFRNRIINGDMRIDQRNAGASVTINSTALSYTIDRFAMYGKTSAGVYTVQRTTSVVPNNFTSAMAITVTTADTTLAAGSQYSFRQRIEGFNIADIGFGTSAAKPLTLSFKVRASVTGTFGGALFNDTGLRCMPFSYTINSADTWTDITVAVPAETAGTWLTTNGDGLEVFFLLGCDAAQKGGTAGVWSGNFYLSPASTVNLISTNGATFYITGVQLEVGSVATPFERRPYGTELSLCQRYFISYGGNGGYETFAVGYNSSTTNAIGKTFFPVEMRTTPSITTSGALGVYDGAAVVSVTSVGSDQPSSKVFNANYTVASGLTAYRPIAILANNSFASRVQFSAEL